MDFLLFGPPGAGKGTQSQRLVDIYKTPQIATGDLMRAERKSGSALGQEFDKYMSKGELVPDSLVEQLLSNRLKQPDAANGAIFDGFPRTLTQAKRLDEILEGLSRRIQAVVHLEVSLETILERASGRRVCPSCGASYHLHHKPPENTNVCDACGHEGLNQRKDDNEDVVRRRHAEYREKTEPVLSHYRAKGIVVEVDGLGELDQVTQNICNALKKLVGEAL